MRTRITVVLLLVLIQAALALTWASSTTSAAPATQACPAAYVVRPGDWLYNIARRFNTTVPALLYLNQGRILYPNLIYAGQVICVPAGGALQPPLQPPKPDNWVSLEVTFQYSPTVQDNPVNVMQSVGGYVGKRVPYRVPASADSTRLYSTTTELAASLTPGTNPSFLVLRNSGTGTSTPLINDYTLVALEPSVLTSLMISDVTPLDTIFPGAHAGTHCQLPVDFVALEPKLTDVMTKSLTMWLEAGNGLRFPLYVSKVTWLENLERVGACGVDLNNTAAFALYPIGGTGSGRYQVSAVLSGDGFGAPHGQYTYICSAWYGSYYYSWLRSWFGC